MSQAYIDFAFVKERASFERVLDHYEIAHRGSGVQRSVLCPFHREKRPSCRVELDRKIFHCFACGASGNILDFVAKLEKTDLRAAAVKIGEICEIPLAPPRRERHKEPQRPVDGRKSREAQKSPPKGRSRSERPSGRSGELVNPPLTFALKLDPEHPYLAERGLKPELVAEFGLGYCGRGVMAGRVCIPIHDETGELVAYAGRWPEDELPEGAERYKLPARFEKSRVLFNLHRVADAEHIVLVEGYWSAIRLHALGVPVAALMGWSVSADQITLLEKRGTRYVTLLLDGDEAGRKGRERALPALADAFFVRAPLLPDGEKPDTIGEAELLELVSPP